MLAAHIAEARASHDYGVTTLIAALITFALGALSVRGEHAVAATAAVLTTIILSLKPILHRWLRRIEQQELTAALKLLLISVVILPILPDRGYGPWQALNPHAVWWLVILIAVISFAAYCAVKIAGPERGILLAGFLGGLVSSTAVSLHLARLAAQGIQRNIIAAGVLVASAYDSCPSGDNIFLWRRSLSFLRMWPSTPAISITSALNAPALASVWIFEEKNRTNLKRMGPVLNETDRGCSKAFDQHPPSHQG